LQKISKNIEKKSKNSKIGNFHRFLGLGPDEIFEISSRALEGFKKHWSFYDAHHKKTSAFCEK